MNFCEIPLQHRPCYPTLGEIFSPFLLEGSSRTDPHDPCPWVGWAAVAQSRLTSRSLFPRGDG